MADLPHQALPEPEINIAKEEDGTEEKEGSEENVSVTTDSEVVASSDSETEDKDKANDYLAIAWNVSTFQSHNVYISFCVKSLIESKHKICVLY